MARDELAKVLEPLIGKLFNVREKRIHPFKDDKVLTDWNGLMIAAFAKAAKTFEEPAYVDVAKKAADFILEKLQTREKALLHSYRDGEAVQPAFLDDYAFFIWGLLELYEATFRDECLKKAVEFTEVLIGKFWDKENGGFFLTPNDSEKLIFRSKDIYDGAIPSGNSVAMLNLLRLARITGNTEFENKAEVISKSFSDIIERSPSGHTMFLCAWDFAEGPSFEVIIVGNPGAEDTRALFKALNSRFLPNKVVLFKPAEESDSDIIKIAPFTENCSTLEGKATVYVCRNHACDLPTTNPLKMLEILSGK